jgi:hypothetical protein
MDTSIPTPQPRLTTMVPTMKSWCMFIHYMDEMGRRRERIRQLEAQRAAIPEAAISPAL